MSLKHTKKLLCELMRREQTLKHGRPIPDSEFNKALDEIEQVTRTIVIVGYLLVIGLLVKLMEYLF
jgi:hypothetical protein